MRLINRNTVKKVITTIIIICILVNIFNMDRSIQKHAYANENTLKFNNLRVAGLSKAYGISVDKCNFSWAIEGNENNIFQTGYSINIYSDKDGKECIYTTDWVNSDDNSFVDVGYEFSENTLYYWSVNVNTNYGIAESDVEAFTTEAGESISNTNGIWLGYNDYVFLKCEENIDTQNIEKAIYSVSGISANDTKQYVYTLYLNGENIGVGPAVSSMENVYYNSYDVTDMLNNGENVFGAICYSEENRSFISVLNVFYKDGSKASFFDTGSGKWLAMSGDNVFGNDQLTSVGTEYYYQAQENINANLYPFDWLTAGETYGFKAAEINSLFDEYSLVSYSSKNMKYYYVGAHEIKKFNEDSVIIDFGKEVIGTVGIDTVAEKNAKITIYYGEVLNEDGSVKYNLNAGNKYFENWTLKKGEQKFNGLNLKCFRYIQIEGDIESFDEGGIYALAIKQEFDDTESEFISSNDLLNNIYELGKYTVNATSQSMYVDSQTRERANYMGDTYINMLTDFVMENDTSLAGFSVEYALNNPTWPEDYKIMSINSVYEYYMHSGDEQFISENYEIIKQYLDEFTYDSKYKLIQSDPEFVLVDWPFSERDGYKVEQCTYNTVINMLFSKACIDMSNISLLLNKTEEYTYYKNLGNTIKASIISKLYNKNTGYFYDGLDKDGNVVDHESIHSVIYALASDVYYQSMANKLAKNIDTEGMNRVSVYATYFLLKGLYNSNNGTIARKIMSDPSIYNGAHTWANMMENATITSEAWDSSIKKNQTYSHPWGSSGAAWLVKGLFGIEPTKAAYKEFKIKLQPGGVESASVKVPTLNGEIMASYNINSDGTLSLVVNIPAGTRATILIPGNVDGMYVNETWTSNTKAENNYISVTLGSGEYKLTGGSNISVDESEMAQYNNVVYRTFAYSWGNNETNGNSSNDITGSYVTRFQLILNTNISGYLRYSTYVTDTGWSDYVKVNNSTLETVSTKTKFNAVRFKLAGIISTKYDIYYRVYIDDYGWLGWAKNGESAGSANAYTAGIKAMEIMLVKKGENISKGDKPTYVENSGVTYVTHVQSYGWLKNKYEGETSGTMGESKRIEAIKINLDNSVYNCTGGISYQTYVQSYGWLNWVNSGEISGTTGKAKRVEGIRIKLTGDMEKNYDIYYSTYVQSYGWLGWAKNGEYSGTGGMAKRMEAIKIVIVPKNAKAPGNTKEKNKVNTDVNYITHVQSYGWTKEVKNGQLSGTTGESKRIEALKININNSVYSGDILYRTHVQKKGWLDFVKNGQLSGTTGEAKRIEAIEIKLTGELAEKYDIYYRCYCQSYGWLGWTKNGASAGTSGLAKRVEAIEIKLVNKGGKAPGDTKNSYIKK